MSNWLVMLDNFYLFLYTYTYVTRFGKTCIVYTSNFSTMVTHKIYLEWQRDVKLSGIVESLLLYHPLKFQICIPFPVFLYIDFKWAKSDVWTMNVFPNHFTYNHWLWFHFSHAIHIIKAFKAQYYKAFTVSMRRFSYVTVDWWHLISAWSIFLIW